MKIPSLVQSSEHTKHANKFVYFLFWRVKGRETCNQSSKWVEELMVFCLSNCMTDRRVVRKTDRLGDKLAERLNIFIVLMYQFNFSINTVEMYLYPSESGKLIFHSRNLNVNSWIFFRGRHRSRTYRSCVRNGSDEDYWKTQEHYQSHRSLHAGRLVDV